MLVVIPIPLNLTRQHKGSSNVLVLSTPHNLSHCHICSPFHMPCRMLVHEGMNDRQVVVAVAYNHATNARERRPALYCISGPNFGPKKPLKSNL